MEISTFNPVNLYTCTKKLAC